MNTTIKRRLEKDLLTAVARLRQRGGGVAAEELAGAIGDNSPGADEVDGSQITTSREIGWATRELLLERVNHLSTALDRLRAGEYGVCIECHERISPARLHALPEVETCVRCQDSLERVKRVGRHIARSQSQLFALTEAN